MARQSINVHLRDRSQKGTDNLLADALSRLKISEYHQESTYVDKIINEVNIVLITKSQVIKLCE